MDLNGTEGFVSLLVGLVTRILVTDPLYPRKVFGDQL